ncbi:UNVERIFIED_CONTAM: hypothetical protein FKN15_010921 [Acipenser sinensis]
MEKLAKEEVLCSLSDDEGRVKDEDTENIFEESMDHDDEQGEILNDPELQIIGHTIITISETDHICEDLAVQLNSMELSSK